MSRGSSDNRYDIIRAGFTGDVVSARSALTHENAEIRASALRALARNNELSLEEITTALSDNEPRVRRCAAELSATRHGVDITALLHDPDVFVAEMAAWALGERETPTDHELDSLIDAVYNHPEALVREAATAALGSLGIEKGLAAILHACNDKPAVRRRAVLALAPFDSDAATAALENALSDRDWQVRQNAEDMLHPRGY